MKMKNWKKMLALVLALVMALSLVACGTSNTPGTDAPSGSDTPSPSAEPIKIGYIYEGSGAYETWGQQDLRGFTSGLYYATNGTMEINGRPIELITQDTACDVGVGVQSATKLLEDEEVDILAGSCISSIALAVMSKAEEAKTPYVISCAASDDITGKNFNRYTFRTGRNLTMANKGMIMGGGDITGKTFVIVSPDYAGGVSAAEAGGAMIEEFGGIVLDYIYPPMDCVDFTPYVQKIKGHNPDFISVTMVGNNYVTKLPQQLREMGALDNSVMTSGVTDFDFLKTMGTNGIGMVGECLYNYNLFPENEVNKEFVRIHQELYNGDLPDYWAGLSFQGALATVYALEKAGSTDAEAFIAAMEGLTFESWHGPLTVRAEDHQGLQPILNGVIVSDGEGGTKVELANMASAEDVTPPITAPGRG